jgi:hypothetical protein
MENAFRDCVAPGLPAPAAGESERQACRSRCRPRQRRLLHPDLETGEPPTIRETPRAWLAIDLDGVKRPACLLAGNLAACAAEAIGQLPDAFRGTFCIAQASASHGIKLGIRLRLWYWLSRPAAGQELKRWLAEQQIFLLATDAPERRLDPTNCLALCHDCHAARAHGE